MHKLSRDTVTLVRFVDIQNKISNADETVLTLHFKKYAIFFLIGRFRPANTN